MNWLYNEKEITDISEFPQGTFGFVYEIITPSGKKYIGKKVLYHNRKRKLTKSELAEQSGRGRKKLFVIESKESDWKKYIGSNTELKRQIIEEEVTIKDLKKQILEIAFNKKHLTYLETKYLFQLGVLENSNLYYNDNILGKFFTKDFDF
tara:strand:- start:202 stop:651 length:450 start_codon:yes stop_codon:yes gene_type:complete